jgi:hypothetical protein
MQELTKLKREVKAPDPHAPRFMKEEFDILKQANVDFYKAMKEQYPELKKYKDSEIANCIEFFNRRIVKEVIDNRNGVRLTDGLGVLVAGACKIPRETVANNINFNALRNGERLSFQNNGTDQYVAKIKYSSEIDKHMFENYSMWCFDASRPFSRTLAAIFKEEGAYKKYIVFTSRQRIAHLFRKQRPKTIDAVAEKRKKTRLEEHDEFAL